MPVNRSTIHKFTHSSFSLQDNFALIFLVFDVEIVFLFPWAVVLREVGMVAFVEILIFVFILFLGLLYAWKKGALRWE